MQQMVGVPKEHGVETELVTDGKLAIFGAFADNVYHTYRVVDSHELRRSNRKRSIVVACLPSRLKALQCRPLEAQKSRVFSECCRRTYDVHSRYSLCFGRANLGKESGLKKKLCGHETRDAAPTKDRSGEN